MQHLAIFRFCAFTAAIACTTAIYAAHPLITDDTGNQGSNHWQLEVNTDGSRTSLPAGTVKQQVVNTTLTYGLQDNLDLAANLPVQRISAPNASNQTGIADISVLAKWRFYDKDGFSSALKPIITIPTGNQDKGLGNGRATASVQWLNQYQQGNWTVLGNLGATYNDNTINARKNLWNASAAVLYSVAEPLQLVADIGTSRNTNLTAGAKNRTSYGLVGAIYHPTKNVDLDVGYRQTLGSSPKTKTLGAGATFRW